MYVHTYAVRRFGFVLWNGGNGEMFLLLSSWPDHFQWSQCIEGETLTPFQCDFINAIIFYLWVLQVSVACTYA